MSFDLYIRKDRYRDTETWWERFSDTIQPRPSKQSLKLHIEHRRQQLDSVGAKLQYEMKTGLPYLHFENDRDALEFILKWVW